MIHSRMLLSPEDAIAIQQHVRSKLLIEASFSMSPRMADVVAILLTKAQYLFSKGQLSTSEFTSQLVVESFELEYFLADRGRRHISNIIADPVNRLKEATFGIEETKDQYVFHKFFDHIEYVDNQLIASFSAMFACMLEVDFKYESTCKIDNKEYLSLTDMHTKRTYELLCYLSESSKDKLFPIEKLQFMYGVFGEDGKIEKPTYQVPRTFIRRIIESSIKSISKNTKLMKAFNFERSEMGTLGYEVYRDLSGDVYIKFLFDSQRNKNNKETLTQLAA
ncbi:hypothetical protein [Vibrio paucivorans]